MVVEGLCVFDGVDEVVKEEVGVFVSVGVPDEVWVRVAVRVLDGVKDDVGELEEVKELVPVLVKVVDGVWVESTPK